MLLAPDQEEHPMPSDQKPVPMPLDADDLATLLAFLCIEIVGALYPLESSPEQTLTDVANSLMDAADRIAIPNRATMLRAIAQRLIATEESGL